MVNYSLVAQVQLNQIIVAFPSFIPKSVVIIRITTEVNTIKPACVSRTFSVFHHILKGAEPSSHMVKHTVQHHFDAVFVQFSTYLPEILVCAQTCVQLTVIPCVIAVSVRLENR